MRMLSLFALPLIAGLAACEFAGQDAVSPPDDTLVGAEERREAMIAAAHPLAVEAGLDAIRSGGGAVDAAIAVQAVLGLVEPQSSGIGGGAFMVHYDAQTQTLTVYDGRETAPAGITETLFLDEAGEPLSFMTAWQSGRSTGVPGVIAMLAMAHEEHGMRPWAEGFADAERLAEEGFAVPPRLSQLAGRVADYTAIDERGPSAQYLFTDAGEAVETGTVLTNPAYAQAMRLVAQDWRNFYTGEIAQGIVETAREEPLPGLITLEDLESYEPLKREALCTPYRDVRICSAPPPASGGVAVGAIMAMLENFDMAAYGPDTATGWHLFIEASRLAYADRDRYVGDPAYADVPTQGLLDEAYLNERARLIAMDRAMESVSAGTPPGAPQAPEDASDDAPGTSHFTIVDTEGDVVSMTTTVESAFGNTRMTPHGFFLNNQMTDFAFAPRDEAGNLRPNAPAPGKRPRSSMSPTIVLDPEGEFLLATGSPGGNSIIAYTAKSLVAMLDWGLTPGQAASLPNVVARGDSVAIETGFDETLLEDLREMGHAIEAGRGENSGIHIVRVSDGGYVGAADPRRDGAALGLGEAALEE
ncbi:gamma-glutamyltransferase [Marinicauda algicola]|uniref:Glutathione hydrolase proenzyme n=1 Tax=Marinicauda algicola TaxID=2029849 RepID=A0A4S2H431_9PROT|nr:gamma-glutamyltransferase [Marinicauda algicola]TGY90042.1 gamma-glutamyltransferase [Marinicauda algicola]